MLTDIQKLEKLIKEQEKQIASLKKGIAGLERHVLVLAKKVDRTYHTGRKNSNEIAQLSGILGKNR